MGIIRLAGAMAAALALAACGASGPTPTPPPGPTPSPAAVPAMPAGVTADNATGFPYAAGTRATTGSYGLHGDNFACLDSRTSGTSCAAGYVALAGSGVAGASLDLLAAQGTTVIPLAPGRVLAASPYCQTVLVDHGSGVWVEYVHLAPTVSPGQPVVRSTPLGTVAPAWPGDHKGNCGLYSDAPHVHLAFLRPDPATGRETFVPMAGVPICGRAVTADGGIDGLAAGKNVAFTVPACAVDGGATAVVPTPTPSPPPTASPSPTPAGEAVLPGLSTDELLASAKTQGLTCASEDVPSIKAISHDCLTHNAGGARDLRWYSPTSDPQAVLRVDLLVQGLDSKPSAERAFDSAFFAFAANAVAYDGSTPSTTASWLAANATLKGGDTVVGHAHWIVFAQNSPNSIIHIRVKPVGAP